MKESMRRATMADSQRLFDWVNAPDSLAAKLLTRGPIARADHETWLAERLADPATFIWIIEVDGEPVGQLRLTPRDGGHEADVYVVPERRHSGLAAQALARAVTELRTAHGARAMIRARVKHDNVASQRLFEQAGFVLAERRDDHLVYVLNEPCPDGSR